MANTGNPITTTMDIDISGLKAGIQEANRQIRLANSAFKAAASEMDFVADSADGLQKKIEQLTAVEEAENKKLENLKKQYALVAQEQGETSTAAQNLQIKINNQQATVNKVSAELNNYKTRLDDVKNASNDTAQETEEQRNAYESLQDTISKSEAELKQLKDAYANVVLEQGDSSQAAQDLAADIQRLSTELSDNKKKLSDVESAADSFDATIDDLGDSAEEAEGGFTIMKGALADFVGNILTGAVDKLGEFVDSLMSLPEETEEFRSMMAKVSGSAESFGYSIDFAKGKYEDFYRYVGDDQMATNAITNLMGMKTSTETLDAIAEGAIATWSAYGDSIPIESLTESIAESANVGKVTGTLADTINWAKRSNDSWAKSFSGNSKAQKAFNKAIEEGLPVEDAYSAALAAVSTTQERADLIAQSLNDTYGTSKQTYDEMSGSILNANDAELKLKESQAQLGQAISPVTTAMTNLKTQALDAISPVITTVANKFGTFLNWLLQTPGATTALAGVLIGLATAFGVLAGALAIQALINGVQKAFALLNITLLANPFVLVAAAVAGLVVAIVTLWNTSETFRNVVTSVWNTIKTIVTGVIKTVMSKVTGWGKDLINFATKTIPQFVNNVKEKISQLPGKIASELSKAIDRVVSWGSNMINTGKQKASNFVDNVISGVRSLPGKIADTLRNVVGKVVTWGSNLASKGKAAAKKLFDSVVNGVKSLPSKMSQLGKDIVSGIWNGITGAAGTLYNNVKNFMGNILKNAKNAIKSNSPSKLWRDEIGKNIVSGIVVGIAGSAASATKSILNLSKDMLNTALSADGNYETVGEKAVSAFSKGIDKSIKKANKSVERLVDEQVKTLTKKHKKNKKKYEEAGKSVIEAYGNAMSKAADKVKTQLSNKLTQISDTYQKKYDEVINLQNTMNQKLADYGDLYTIDDEGNLVLGDIRKDINTLNQYSKNINALKGKISDDLMNEIINMNVEDAVAYTNALMKMSAAELNNYNALYSQKLATANSISKNFYAQKLQEIQTEYSAKVQTAFADAKTAIQNAGEDAVNGFVEGMAKSAKKNNKTVKKLAKQLAKAFKKALKIKSPSKVFEEMGLYSGEGYEVGLVKSMRQAKDTLTGLVRNVRTRIGSGGKGSGQSAPTTYNFYQTNNSPKPLSRLEIYRQSKNLLKGVAVSV